MARSHSAALLHGSKTNIRILLSSSHAATGLREADLFIGVFEAQRVQRSRAFETLSLTNPFAIDPLTLKAQALPYRMESEAVNCAAVTKPPA
jgi:hypothetical protein